MECGEQLLQLGYRPLVLTRAGEAPLPGGDFVTIVVSNDGASAQLLRSTKLRQVTSANDWITSATSDGSSTKVFRQGPTLPNPNVSVVQSERWARRADVSSSVIRTRVTARASGRGRAGKPVGAWSYQPARTDRRRLVGFSSTRTGRRRLYVLVTDRVWRSDNGGGTWLIDTALETQLTEGGAFPVGLTSESSSAQVLLRDMVFDPDDPKWRVAIGPAGIFLTLDGVNWRHLLVSSAAGFRPNNAVYDKVSTPCARMLYVSTSNRGVLRLGPLPPDWERCLVA
jgi:hypothetical protein